MKTTTLLLFLICSCQAIAQSTNLNTATRTLQKKTRAVGLYANYGSSPIIGNQLGFSAYGGYFIANKLLLGLNGGYATDWSNTVEGHVSSWLTGPFIRYYLTSSRVTPFAEASYQFGQFMISSPYNMGQAGIRHSANTLSFTGGLGVRLTQAFRLELAYNYQADRFSPAPLVQRNWQGYPQAGLSAFF